LETLERSLYLTSLLVDQQIGIPWYINKIAGSDPNFFSGLLLLVGWR